MTTNTPSVFNFNNNEVRTIVKDGEPWFLAADVCAALGVNNHRESVRHLDDDEKGVISNDTLGGTQQVSIVNESGLYALVLRSRKPEAKKFTKWVTSEVLPAIRKTGKYEVTTITPAMQSDLHAIVDKISPDGKKKGNVWSRFNRHFKIAKYNQLQSAQFEEAKTYLVNTFLEGEYIEREALSEAEISQLAIKALVETKFALRFVQMENGQLLPQVFSHHKDAQTFVPAGLIRDIRDKTFKFMPDDMIPDLISAISHRLRTPATA